MTHDKKKRKQKEQALKRYGLLLPEYSQMVKDQGYACAICQTPAHELFTKLAVDHDHSTGKIRGLLCSACNMGLGCFKDSREIIDRARVYLSKQSLQFKTNLPINFSQKGSLINDVESVEKERILKTLQEFRFNQTRTALALGLKRSTLQYKLKKYHLL